MYKCANYLDVQMCKFHICR